jgi:hypothetical protein
MPVVAQLEYQPLILRVKIWSAYRYVCSFSYVKSICCVGIGVQHRAPLPISYPSISENTGQRESFEKYLYPVSALLTTFIGVATIFGAFWMMHFGRNERRAIVLGIVGTVIGSAIFLYGFNVLLNWSVGI